MEKPVVYSGVTQLIVALNTAGKSTQDFDTNP